jgi:hypothetical protein
MSKAKGSLINEQIENELKQSAFFSRKEEPKEEKITDIKSEIVKVIKLPKVIDNTTLAVEKIKKIHRPKSGIDIDKLIKVVELSYPARVDKGFVVRRSDKEKSVIKSFLTEDAKFIAEFPSIQLSESKLYRIALMYIIQNHKDEFLFALQEALSKKEDYEP